MLVTSATGICAWHYKMTKPNSSNLPIYIDCIENVTYSSMRSLLNGFTPFTYGIYLIYM